jgi:hypothetical protein
MSAPITAMPVAAATTSQPVDLIPSRSRSLLRCLRPGRCSWRIVTPLMVAPLGRRLRRLGARAVTVRLPARGWRCEA